MKVCVGKPSRCFKCRYCEWGRRHSMLTYQHDPTQAIAITETLRLAHLMSPAEIDKMFNVSNKSDKLQRTRMTDVVSTQSIHDIGIPHVVRRLAKFQRLLTFMGTAEWANMYFSVNRDIEKCLTASHLRLIVGDVQGYTTELYHMIDPWKSVSEFGNLAWITNRQQGKTSTLAKFFAALVVASPTGGFLTGIYATALHKTVELLKAVKQYVVWLQDKSHIHGYKFEIIRDNYSELVVDNGEAQNEIMARPKSHNTCRGDAPESVAIDEAGFVEKKLWFDFAYPLLLKRDRIFTCTTTPPEPDGFFMDFIKRVQSENAKGDYFFRLINHALACPSCIDNGYPEKCCHLLYLIPPWKGILRFKHMLRLVPPAQRRDMYVEVFGTLNTDVKSYFPPYIVDPIFNRKPLAKSPCGPQPYVWVAIDPASHMKSYMGISARVTGREGQKVIIGLAAVPVDRCESLQIKMIIRQFLTRLRSHPFVARSSILVPIIECNGSDIMANTILSAFESFRPVYMPFTEDNFKAFITPGIGVWTTKANKMAAIQKTFEAFFDNSIMFAQVLATADQTAFNPNRTTITAPEHKETARTQLTQFRDQPDGSVSGKSPSGDMDDLGMALILSIYWPYVVQLRVTKSLR